MVKLNETDLRLKFKTNTGVTVSQFDIDNIKDEDVIKYLEWLQERLLIYDNMGITIQEVNEAANTVIKEENECYGGCNCGE